jgi:hypothetical protein
VLVKGDIRSVADFQFAGRDGDLHGTYWDRALTPVALSNVQLGNSIHFEVPAMAVFEGTVSGEMIEGTFRDENGGGSFRLAKQPDWDDPRFAP